MSIYALLCVDNSCFAHAFSNEKIRLYLIVLNLLFYIKKDVKKSGEEEVVESPPN